MFEILLFLFFKCLHIFREKLKLGCEFCWMFRGLKKFFQFWVGERIQFEGDVRESIRVVQTVKKTKQGVWDFFRFRQFFCFFCFDLQWKDENITNVECCFGQNSGFDFVKNFVCDFLNIFSSIDLDRFSWHKKKSKSAIKTIKKKTALLLGEVPINRGCGVEFFLHEFVEFVGKMNNKFLEILNKVWP